MAQPFDYRLNVADPFAAAAQGLQLGASIQELQQKRQDREMAIQAAERKRQMEAEWQAQLQAVAASPSAQGYIKLATLRPDLSEGFKRSMDMLTTDQKEARLASSTRVLSALESNRPDIAETLLQEQAEAFRNAGDETQAKAYDDAVELVRNNPAAAKNVVAIGLAATAGPEKFAEAYNKMGEEGRARDMAPAELRKAEAVAQEAEESVKIKREQALREAEKIAADLGLTNAQKNKALAETKKLGIESQKAALELEALQATGGIDPEKKFIQEEKLRKEFTDRTKKYTEMRGVYSNITNSAKDKSGAGDIALVTSFMKMLDPGSVVRETEFATGRDTAGLLTQLKNQAKKLQSGEFLDEKQRTAFARLAAQYMAAAEAQEKQVVRSLDKVVTSYKLDRGNVFGEERAQTPTPPANPALPIKLPSPSDFTVKRIR